MKMLILTLVAFAAGVSFIGIFASMIYCMATYKKSLRIPIISIIVFAVAMFLIEGLLQVYIVETYNTATMEIVETGVNDKGYCVVVSDTSKTHTINVNKPYKVGDVVDVKITTTDYTYQNRMTKSFNIAE